MAKLDFPNLIGGMVLGVVGSLLVDVFWQNSAEQRELDLTAALVKAETSLSDKEEALKSRDLELGKLKSDVEKLSQNVSQFRGDLQDSKAALDTEKEKNRLLERDLKNALTRIETLTNLIDAQEKASNNLSLGASDLLNALEMLDILYIGVQACLQDLAAFSTLQEAFREIGDESVNNAMSCAAASMGSFVRAQDTYRDQISSAFNGLARDLYENKDIPQEKLFHLFLQILSEENQRKKEIITALDRLYRDIAGQ